MIRPDKSVATVRLEHFGSRKFALILVGYLRKPFEYCQRVKCRTELVKVDNKIHRNLLLVRLRNETTSVT